MNLSGLEIPGYIITLVVILISVYALYYLGSHRYQVIQEGFKNWKIGVTLFIDSP